jgi:O-antigen ligase
VAIGIVTVLIISGILAIAISQMPYVKWRIQQTFVKNYDGEQDNQNGLAVRAKIWQTAVKLIKKKPLTGYGPKSGYTTLVEEYRVENFSVAAEAGYNAHNNFLQTMLNYGLPGIVVLLVMLLSAFTVAVKRFDLMLLVTLILVTSLCMTECMLEVQKGIVFFGLFVPLYIYHNTSNRTSATTSKTV